MKKIVVIDQPRCKPVYDKNMNLLHWQMTYKLGENVTETRYFRNTLFSRGFKKMCRFKNRLVLKQNEHDK